MFIKLIVVFIVLFVSSGHAFSDWMTKDYCNRQLIVGEIIMNEDVILSDSRIVEVFRGKTALKSGEDSYQPGEKLTVKISNASNQYVYEVNGKMTKNNKHKVEFSGGGCDGKRIANKPSVELSIPVVEESETATEPIHIVVAWAEGHAQVKISPTFVLLSPQWEGSNGGTDGAPQKVEAESQHFKVDTSVEDIKEGVLAHLASSDSAHDIKVLHNSIDSLPDQLEVGDHKIEIKSKADEARAAAKTAETPIKLSLHPHSHRDELLKNKESLVLVSKVSDSDADSVASNLRRRDHASSQIKNTDIKSDSALQSLINRGHSQQDEAGFRAVEEAEHNGVNLQDLHQQKQQQQQQQQQQHHAKYEPNKSPSFHQIHQVIKDKIKLHAFGADSGSEEDSSEADGASASSNGDRSGGAGSKKKGKYAKLKERVIFKSILYIVLIVLLIFSCAFCIRYRFNMIRLIRRYLGYKVIEK